MPVVGATAYYTAGQVFTLARACLNDSGGLLFSDPVLQPYLSSAYRQVQRALAVAGGPLFITDNVQFTLAPVVTPDPAIQTSLTDSGYSNGTTLTNPPQLPVDLLEPDKLWERPTGTNADFVEMTDLTEGGGLPSLPQGGTLAVWEWRTDGIFFLGSTVSVDVRMRYQKAYPDVTDGTSSILIRNSIDCLAYNTAAMAAMGRASPLADKWAQAGEQALENLVAAATRREQNRPRRRRPNSSKTGGYWSGSWHWGFRS